MIPMSWIKKLKNHDKVKRIKEKKEVLGTVEAPTV